MVGVFYIVRFTTKDGRNYEHIDPQVPTDRLDADALQARGHEILATVETPERLKPAPRSAPDAVREYRAITEEQDSATTRCPACNGAVVLHYQDGEHVIMHDEEPCRLQPLPDGGSQ